MSTSIDSLTSTVSTNYAAVHSGVTTNSANDEKKVVENTSVKNITAITEEPTLEALKTSVSEGNRMLKNASSNLQFQIDDSTKQVVVKIVDDKGEVIRQIPTVEMLGFIRHMKELEGNSGALLKAVV